MKCADCKFWNALSAANRAGLALAECRRHAPRTGRDGRWPYTASADFCGDFEEYTEPTPQITLEEIEQLAAQPKPIDIDDESPFFPAGWP